MFLNKKKNKTEKEKEEREGERRKPEWQILNQAYNNRKLIDILPRILTLCHRLGGMVYYIQ